MSTVLQARKLFTQGIGGAARPMSQEFTSITIADDAQAAALLALGPMVEIVADAAGLALHTVTVQAGYSVIDRGIVYNAGSTLTITQTAITALGPAVA